VNLEILTICSRMKEERDESTIDLLGSGALCIACRPRGSSDANLPRIDAASDADGEQGRE
jgi:hypothetical protein